MEYLNFSQEQLNREFIRYCFDGNLEKIKYLLTSHELKIHAEINYQEHRGVRWATEKNYQEIVKYILTSPELKEHSDVHAKGDMLFFYVIQNNHYDIAKFLIFDMNIEKTERIKIIVSDKKYPAEKFEQMFQLRELNNNLKNNLSKKNKNKKIRKL